MRLHTILKQASAKASAHATEDQASSHGAPAPPKRDDFELEVTEEAPTEDQVKSILEYLGGPSNAGKIFAGAKNEAEALKQLKADPNSFIRPVVCRLRSSEETRATLLTSCRLSIGTMVAR